MSSERKRPLGKSELFGDYVKSDDQNIARKMNIRIILIWFQIKIRSREEETKNIGYIVSKNLEEFCLFSRSPWKVEFKSNEGGCQVQAMSEQNIEESRWLHVNPCNRGENVNDFKDMLYKKNEAEWKI